LPAQVSKLAEGIAMSMSPAKAEINVTPLIDVLLVLIIIFMVVLPEHSVGLPAILPQPAPPDANPIPKDTDIIVSVNQDHSISVNQQPVAIERLQERLRAIFAARATRVIFVRGYRDLDFQEIARVIDIAKSADVFQVGLMTE
jgi:biopolymer transport protein ExbD